MAIIRIDAADAIAGAARSPGDGALFESFGRDSLEQRNLGLQVVEIVHREFDLAAGLGAARLQRSASGENKNKICAPGAESDPESALEARTVSEQQHDRGDSPRHAQHR